MHQMTRGPTGTDGDADLAAAFRRDPQAFAMVHARYFTDVYRYTAGRLGAQTAEDITADTFCDAFRLRERYDATRGGLRPWLLGIATNLIARHTRREARRYRALSRGGGKGTVPGPEDDTLARIAAARMRPELARAMASLSRGERDVVTLVALGHLSYQEVAAALGVSQGTVGSRLSRARRRLREAIDRGETHG